MKKIIVRALFVGWISIMSVPWICRGFWKYVHEPIDRKSFARGVSVGASLQQCGVKPSPELIEHLSHFVEGDMSAHNCTILRREGITQ